LRGGVNTVTDILRVADECLEEGGVLDGVMVGRGIVAQPWYWCCLDYVIYGDRVGNEVENRRDLIREYGKWADEEEEREGSKKARRR